MSKFKSVLLSFLVLSNFFLMGLGLYLLEDLGIFSIGTFIFGFAIGFWYLKGVD